MEKEPEVSVILPVYNVAGYVRECLQTIVTQTLQDVEIICVDDGSTDGSSEILLECAAKDSRIKVIRQDNAGAGAARNRGMDSACGRYLYFCDPDDCLVQSALNEMCQAMESESADICVCRYVEFEDATGEVIRVSRFGEMFAEPLRQGVRSVEPATAEGDVFYAAGIGVWNKLFRRAFVVQHGLRFQEIRRTNDLFFAASALVSASRIAVVDKPLYFYRKGIASVTTKDMLAFSFCDALAALKDRMVRDGLYSRYRSDFAGQALRSFVGNVKSIADLSVLTALYPRMRAAILNLVEDGSGLDPSHKAVYDVLRQTDDLTALLHVFVLEGKAAEQRRHRQKYQGATFRTESLAGEFELPERPEERLRQKAKKLQRRLAKQEKEAKRWKKRCKKKHAKHRSNAVRSREKSIFKRLVAKILKRGK